MCPPCWQGVLSGSASLFQCYVQRQHWLSRLVQSTTKSTNPFEKCANYSATIPFQVTVKRWFMKWNQVPVNRPSWPGNISWKSIASFRGECTSSPNSPLPPPPPPRSIKRGCYSLQIDGHESNVLVQLARKLEIAVAPVTVVLNSWQKWKMWELTDMVYVCLRDRWLPDRSTRSKPTHTHTHTHTHTYTHTLFGSWRRV